MVETYELWTDGASSGVADAPGGWAAILVHENSGTKLGLCGWAARTTNNRMEMQAVVKGLEAIGSGRGLVTICTDSAYVKNGYTFIPRWQSNGWISSRGDAVANRDLWEQLAELGRAHMLKWRKIKGHGNVHSLNIQADAMAVQAKKLCLDKTEILP